MAEHQPGPIPAQDTDEQEEDYPISPDFWDTLLGVVPPWGDEIVALLLIIFGILSFLSVFDVLGTAPIAAAWSSTLGSLFGYGSLIVSAGILLLGVVIVLANVGVVVAFPSRRIIALEVVFISSLALLHLFEASGAVEEMRPIARAGRGGGLFGWALGYPTASLLGYTTAFTLFSALLVGGIGVAIGVRRIQIKQTLLALQARFDALGDRLAERPVENRKRRRAERRRRVEATRRLALELESPSKRLRTPILRVRPDLENIPPSLRPGARSKPAKPVDDDLEEHPLFRGEATDNPFNIIGKIIEEDKKKKAPKQVKRPDGRVKRYFTVGEMDEPRKTGRRRKDWPPLDLLADIEMNRPDEEEINTKVVLIENTLLEFDIDINVVDVKVGPTVTQYLIKPYNDDASERTQRTRISKIASYQNDLALALSAKRLRIEAPVPGTNYVGIEVPNNDPSVVALRSVYESKVYYEALQKAKTPLFVPLGRDVAGKPFTVDLAEMPHTLVAGTTGSGKSVALAALTVALILHHTPAEVRLVMLDPKMVELSRFEGLPHLLGPVETDVERIIGVLRWCTREMEDRYRKLEDASARNIITYNQKMEKERGGEKLPYIVIMIDEVGDLMMSNPDDTEHNLTRLAQMARAVGIHLIVATQRPSVDVLTGLIKANFPGRIAFSVASGVDSRVILDTVGAEALLGKGDMLFLSNDAAGPKRLQGCFVGDDQVRDIVDYWKNWAHEQRAKGKLEERRGVPWEKTLSKLELLSQTDDLLEDALQAVVNAQEASATMLQKYLNIGFPRASRIMDLLFELGAIGPPEPGGKMRKVLISSYRKDPMKELIERQKEQEAERERIEAKAAKIKEKEAEYYDEDDE